MLKLDRTIEPDQNRVFFAMPMGSKTLPDGRIYDFDPLYRTVFVPVVRDCGMQEERADEIFGTTHGVMDAAWHGLQRAHVVIVDLTIRSADVALELGLAMALGKRMIVLTQNRDDVPTDLRGHVRPKVYSPDGMGLVELITELKQLLITAREEAVTENTFVPLRGAGTDPTPGTIIKVCTDHAVVDTEERGPRRFCELGNADVDYGRLIPDMTRLFRLGQRLHGAIVTDAAGEFKYSLLNDKRNPWPGIVGDFPEGHVFRSRVVHLRDEVGAFVALADGVNGLVPGTDARRARLAVGSEVEVEILRVDADSRRVSLRLRHNLQTPVTPPAAGYPAGGTRVYGQVLKAVPESDGRGGFMVLRLDGPHEWPTAILHHSQMTAELRAELNGNRFDGQEDILVEVVRCDPVGKRISVREVPEETAEVVPMQPTVPADRLAAA
jgi:hypothetical protein